MRSPILKASAVGLAALALSATVLAADKATPATPAATAAAPATDWAATARQDLLFAADSIRSGHAGAVAGLPSVTVQLETGLRAGLAEADSVRSEEDYKRLMLRFVSGFGDPHTAINLQLALRGWTGLVLDRVDGRYRVIWSEPGWPTPLPPQGSIAQSCDGVWTGTWLTLRAAPFANHSTEYPTTYSKLARLAMFDMGLGSTPRQCVFDLPDGSRRAYALPLRSVPGEVSKERIDVVRKGVLASATPVGLTRLAADKVWVGMPDFNGAKSGSAYEALYPQLAALPKSGWVVFDLRGNGGGNSGWGTRALAALFGKPYAEQLGQAGGASKYMIADQATVDLLKHYIAAPEFAASRDGMQADLLKVEAAIRAGSKLALVSERDAPESMPKPRWPRPHGPRLAAVIDRECFSSCMNFLQQVMASGDAVILGESTIGYSPFGEINRRALPSGRGFLYVPSALFRTASAPREPFVPDHPYGGNMADDAALQTWVKTTLEGIRP